MCESIVNDCKVSFNPALEAAIRASNGLLELGSGALFTFKTVAKVVGGAALFFWTVIGETFGVFTNSSAEFGVSEKCEKWRKLA